MLCNYMCSGLDKCYFYTPRKHSFGGGYIGIGLSVRPSVCPEQLPHLLSDFHQTLWNLRS